MLTKALFVATVACSIQLVAFGPAHSQTVCSPNMAPAVCAEAQLSAIGKIFGEYKSEMAQRDAEIKSLQEEANRTKAAFAGGRILAVATVIGGQIDPKSSRSDVWYKAASHRFHFPNPLKLDIVPIVSHVSLSPGAEGKYYVTLINFIQEIDQEEVTISGNALDTGGQVSPPSNFTILILGFEKPAQK